MNYRNAVQADLPAIEEILDNSFEKIYAYYAKKSYSGLLNAIVAEEGAIITGAINYRILEAGEKKLGYLYYLAVHTGYRRKGIGKDLVRRAIQSIEETGKMDVFVVIEKKNEPSRSLVLQNGFVPISRSAVRDKFGKGTTKLFMQMNLMPWEELFVLPGK